MSENRRFTLIRVRQDLVVKIKIARFGYQGGDGVEEPETIIGTLTPP